MSKVAAAAQTNGAPPKPPITRSFTIAGAFAAGLVAWAPAAFAQSRVEEGPHMYKALQSISYEFGSKFSSGYFEARDGTCLVTLMVIEKSPADDPLPFSAARIRLALNPGQIAGLDSEEGRSLNFTCGEGATTLLVDAGDRDRLMALQALTRQKTAVDLQEEGPAKIQ